MINHNQALSYAIHENRMKMKVKDKGRRNDEHGLISMSNYFPKPLHENVSTIVFTIQWLKMKSKLN